MDTAVLDNKVRALEELLMLGTEPASHTASIRCRMRLMSTDVWRAPVTATVAMAQPRQS